MYKLITNKLPIFVISLVSILLLINFALSTSLQTDPVLRQISWQEYKDPDGYFTIKIPQNWQTAPPNRNPQLGSPYKVTSDFNFKNQDGSAKIALTVNEDNEIMQKDMCAQYGHGNPPQTTFAGLPANSYDLRGWTTYTFQTNAADYQISYRVPDHLGGEYTGLPILQGDPTPTIIPLSPEVVKTNREIVQAAINSFKPIPATPFPCTQQSHKKQLRI